MILELERFRVDQGKKSSKKKFLSQEIRSNLVAISLGISESE